VMAMVSSTAVHSRLLKGLRKLFQFVDMPGFLMYSENLPRQEDILRVLGSVECRVYAGCNRMWGACRMQ
jgi:hypothetical protein